MRAHRRQPFGDTLQCCAVVGALLLLVGCGSSGQSPGEIGGSAPTAVSAGNAAAEKPADNRAEPRYSWMSAYLPWEEGGLTVLRQFHTKPSEEPAIYAEKVRDFTLYCTIGANYERVYAVLRIESNGAAVAAYQEYPSRRCYQKSFRLDARQMQALTRCLYENGIGNLAESYVDTKTEDGAQGGITLRSGKQTRRTYLSNAWPKPVRNLFEYLSENHLRFIAGEEGSGFALVDKSILQTDPETTLAARGLVRSGNSSMQAGG